MCGAYRRKLSADECCESPPEGAAASKKKRIFCHNHNSLEKKCCAYSKSSRKFCDNDAIGPLRSSCAQHASYIADCNACVESVIPSNRYCNQHQFLNNQTVSADQERWVRNVSTYLNIC